MSELRPAHAGRARHLRRILPAAPDQRLAGIRRRPAGPQGRGRRVDRRATRRSITELMASDPARNAAYNQPGRVATTTSARRARARRIGCVSYRPTAARTPRRPTSPSARSGGASRPTTTSRRRASRRAPIGSWLDVSTCGNWPRARSKARRPAGTSTTARSATTISRSPPSTARPTRNGAESTTRRPASRWSPGAVELGQLAREVGQLARGASRHHRKPRRLELRFSRSDGIRTSQDGCANGTWLRYQPWCGCWAWSGLYAAGKVRKGDSWLASVASIEDYAKAGRARSAAGRPTARKPRRATS
jgi:hypothetical protein